MRCPYIEWKKNCSRHSERNELEVGKGFGAGMNVTQLGTTVVDQARDAGSLDLAGGSGDGRSNCTKGLLRKQSQ